MTLQTKEKLEKLTPELALDMLKEGNLRFVCNQRLNRDLLAQAKATKIEQYPFAVVLSCIDSRTSTELIFDQGIGDIFSIRIAGNVVNDDILGSIEFACKFIGSKLIVVLGHTDCGAIKGAYNNVEVGNLTGLLGKIKPAIENVRQYHKTDIDFNAITNDIVRENVVLAMQQIQNNSPILKQLLEEKEIKLVGGIHNIASGKVHFY